MIRKTGCWLAGIGLLLLPLPSIAQPPSSTSAARALLAEQCQALVTSAVSRPYGLGWPADDPNPSPYPRIALTAGDTPAAALVLLRAGQVLKDPKLTSAALDAVRTLVICQSDSGRIPEQAIFATFVAPRDMSPGARDRASTVAALGLFLEVIQTQPVRDERVVVAAGRCASWLARQQLRDGAWPTELPFQPDDPSLPTHILKLNSADWRNCTLALLVAGDVLNRPDFGRGGEAASNVLILLQLKEPHADWARGWASAYRVNGVPLKGLFDIPYAMDTTASLYAGQTLMGRYLLTYDEASAEAMRHLAATLKPLRDAGGAWYRLYGLPGSPRLSQTRPSAYTRGGLPLLFSAPPNPSDDPTRLAPPGVADLLTAIDQLPGVHLDASRSSSAPQSSRFDRRNVERDIISTVCGLMDAPFSHPNPTASNLDQTPPDPVNTTDRIRLISHLLTTIDAQ